MGIVYIIEEFIFISQIQSFFHLKNLSFYLVAAFFKLLDLWVLAQAQAYHVLEFIREDLIYGRPIWIVFSS